MEINWAYVKKETLWQYEDLIAQLRDVLAFGFIQEHYDHSMDEAANYSVRIRQGYLQKNKEATFIDEITAHFNTLENLGIENYQDLIRKVSTRAECEAFLLETGFSFYALIQTLNFLFRWILPFQCPLKEFLDAEDKNHMEAIEALRNSRIRSNLDLLETCRARAGRTKQALETGILKALLLELVHRVDISRLAYVRGKTVKHLCGGGYDTLDKIANASLEKMQADMTAYYESIGKSFSDFKAVIPLDWMKGGAAVLPKVVEHG